MMYIYMLCLCFLSRSVLCDPNLEFIGSNSSNSCGNFTALDGNYQSVTFKISGDWGNSVLDIYNTPYLRYSNNSVICLLVNDQGECTIQSNKYYTCTCENKTGGVYYLTFTSSPSTPLASYTIFMNWSKFVSNTISEYVDVKEVKDESCPCEVNWKCIIVKLVLISAAALGMVVLLSCWRFKKLSKKDHKSAWIPNLLVALLFFILVIIGDIVCYATVKDCLLAGEMALIGIGICIVCFNLMLSSFLCWKFGPVICSDGKMSNPEIGPKPDQTKQSNNSKSQISLLIVVEEQVEEQVFVNSLLAGGTGTRIKENGKKKKALKKKETGDESKGETSSPKPVKQASFKEGAVRRKGTEDNVEIPLTPLGLENQVSNSQGAVGNKGTSGISDTSSTTSPESESQVSNDQGAAKSAGTDVVRNEKASGDKNSDRPSTTPPESQGKKEGKKASKNEANENRRNSVPTKTSENQGTYEPANAKKLAWSEHTEKVQKASEKEQTGNKDNPQHKNKAQSSSSGSKSRPQP